MPYLPRRCDRCWYWHEEDQTCHRSPPNRIDWQKQNYEHWPIGLWPATTSDAWCGEFFPRDEAEKKFDPALPEEAKPKKKKKAKSR